VAALSGRIFVAAVVAADPGGNRAGAHAARRAWAQAGRLLRAGLDRGAPPTDDGHFWVRVPPALLLLSGGSRPGLREGAVVPNLVDRWFVARTRGPRAVTTWARACTLAPPLPSRTCRCRAAWPEKRNSWAPENGWSLTRARRPWRTGPAGFREAVPLFEQKCAGQPQAGRGGS